MSDLLVEREEHLILVTMNRPHRKNAQTPGMYIRMADAWKEASADDAIRCIVLTVRAATSPPVRTCARWLETPTRTASSTWLLA